MMTANWATGSPGDFAGAGTDFPLPAAGLDDRLFIRTSLQLQANLSSSGGTFYLLTSTRTPRLPVSQWTPGLDQFRHRARHH